MTTTIISIACCYEIRPPFLFRWEDSQQAHVLLYPEGIVKLNTTGGKILQRCDGKTSVAELIDQLALSYNASNVDAIRNGVLNFLEVSHGKGWIRAKA
ncbi:MULTISPECIES: pyrroloquinoline quinone biosynthesis peptide chaperone PqqD [Stutzerimonas stutzeri subgroup]|uniref:pyrroloquinoline quinone biosynthesis peptide chaperone PqqD n=1 Tax=Stutzerimonas stutzeri subgroup TaxID=578833 RepID=UPI00034C76F3|nr:MULTISPECIES: pyrroloquinoline quinone biosynthesis peptide chaperone PqqD [Stutzerimonas stutzeri subgroup]MBK3882958.1 pyrroloquinoline quinone biosynthesis peptide chaperone PqqD [Stutzerimonas stutzeri]MCQ4290438.1 pyrroloquinoline quinone biosynthesis peptide chaperone PqqD [Stutzerimonas stutzeri]WOF79364.1 pyrroloquinoline quinone biosynthesis peptide chaperone PqqD [Pseudomonas sp. FeN3W]